MWSGMKRFVCVILMLLCLSGLKAQDNDNISVQPSDSLGMKKRDSVLLKKINFEDMFRKKIIEIDSSSFDAQEIKKRLKTSYSDYRQWRFGVNSGLEIIIAPEPAEISEELLKYKKTLKSGIRFGVDALFFISPNIGIGVNYSTYSASNKTNYITYEIDENQFTGARQDDINIYFAGPAISIRSIPKHNKYYASCDFIIGYFGYSNNLILDNIPYHLKEDNFGFSTSVGADFMLTRNMSMGLALNILAASIKNMEIFNGNKVENLSRISLVMTLRTYR
jgi:opacity protein-like surface antigen